MRAHNIEDQTQPHLAKSTGAVHFYPGRILYYSVAWDEGGSHDAIIVQM